MGAERERDGRRGGDDGWRSVAAVSSSSVLFVPIPFLLRFRLSFVFLEGL